MTRAELPTEIVEAMEAVGAKSVVGLLSHLTTARANLIRAQQIEEEARLFEQARANAAEARLNALITVHARYFDMDYEAGEPDVNPSPEDVWRYDRDFRAALKERRHEG